MPVVGRPVVFLDRPGRRGTRTKEGTVKPETKKREDPIRFEAWRSCERGKRNTLCLYAVEKKNVKNAMIADLPYSYPPTITEVKDVYARMVQMGKALLENKKARVAAT